MQRLSVFVFVFAALLSIGVSSRSASAATGEVISQINRPACSNEPASGILPGLAYRDFTAHFTCGDPPSGLRDNRIHKTNIFGEDLGTITPINSVTGLPVRPGIDAIAWDSDEGVFWGTSKAWTGPGLTALCAIWRINPSTGIATLAFTYSAPECNLGAGSPGHAYGLAVDSSTDTLYAGPSNVIRHLNKDGMPGANGNIDFGSLTAAECPNTADHCRFTGFTMNDDGLLVVAATGSFGPGDAGNRLFLVDPQVPEIDMVYSTLQTNVAVACPTLYWPLAATGTGSPSKINLLEPPDTFCGSVIYNVRLYPLLWPPLPSGGPGDTLYAYLFGQYIAAGPDAQSGEGRVEIFLEYLEPHRLIAAPGDLCFFRPLVGGVPFPLPCAEGDDPSGNVPSVGGAACFDGIDNDNDGVMDAADSDCQGTVNYIRFDAEPTDGYETFYRGVAFLCFNPGERIAGFRSFAQGPGQWDTGEASTFQTTVKCEAN